MNQAYAQPQNYTLDSEHTHIVWQVDRFGFTKTIGTFIDISGQLVIDEEIPNNSTVSAEISLSGLRSDLLAREDIVRSKYWLDAEHFPVITFTSSSVTLNNAEECGGKCAVIKGTMTLKGVSAPLVLNVKLNKTGPNPVTRQKAMGFSATGAFTRSMFGVKTAVGPVGDEVTFQIEALAIASY